MEHLFMANVMNDTAYIMIKGWMVNRLKLSGNALMIYAIIYGFSQGGGSEYQGSVEYLANCAGIQRRQAKNILNELLAEGLVEKSTVKHGRNGYTNYKINGAKIAPINGSNGEKITPFSDLNGAKITSQMGQSLPLNGAKIAHHINNILITHSSSTTTTILNFQNACKKAGFSLDKEKAEEILNAGLDPSWLSGDFDFVKYTASYIQEAYGHKPIKEQRSLFIAAFEWPDHREEFPAWRDEKIAAAAKREARRLREAEEEQQRLLIAQERENSAEKPGLAEVFQETIRNQRGPGP
jgi:hypothetical protein